MPSTVPHLLPSSPVRTATVAPQASATAGRRTQVAGAARQEARPASFAHALGKARQPDAGTGAGANEPAGDHPAEPGRTRPKGTRDDRAVIARKTLAARGPKAARRPSGNDAPEDGSHDGGGLPDRTDEPLDAAADGVQPESTHGDTPEVEARGDSIDITEDAAAGADVPQGCTPSAAGAATSSQPEEHVAVGGKEADAERTNGERNTGEARVAASAGIGSGAGEAANAAAATATSISPPAPVGADGPAGVEPENITAKPAPLAIQPGRQGDTAPAGAAAASGDGAPPASGAAPAGDAAAPAFDAALAAATDELTQADAAPAGPRTATRAAGASNDAGSTEAAAGPGAPKGFGPNVSKTPGPALPMTPPTPAEFAESNHAKMVSAVHGELMPGGGTMRIRLDPPELGALQVTVRMRDGAMTASFETSNDDATKLLSHSLGQLKQALETQGVSVEKLQVQQAPKQEQARQEGGEGSQQRRQHSTEEEASARQEQQRKEMLRRMWRRLSGGGDPLDLVA